MSLGNADSDLATAIWSLQYNLGHGVSFLRAYARWDADAEMVERLRRRYKS